MNTETIEKEVMKMLKIILQRELKKSKSILPNPNLDFKLVFKPGALSYIKKVKGWRTDQEGAVSLGITRQYFNMLRRNKVSVTTTVITRLAVLLGNLDKNWWTHFTIVPRGEFDPNHPMWNQEKYMGRKPYGALSSLARLRKQDYETEEKKLFDP